MMQLKMGAVLMLICGICMSPEILAGDGNRDLAYKQKGGIESTRRGERDLRGKIVRGDEKEGFVCFTFDDGPDYRTTPVLLDQLDKYGIKAAFFINGAKIHSASVSGEENRTVLREIATRGHYIGNHTFSHKDIRDMSEDEWNREVRQVERMIVQTIGKAIKIFRPPFGSMSNVENDRITRDGYRAIMWNIDPLDWKSSSARQIVKRFATQIEENPKGGIVVMHDTNRSAIEAFPLMIEWMEERNFHRRVMKESTLKVVGIDRYLDK